VPTTKIKVTLFIRRQQVEELKKIAAARDVSLASLVREGIDIILKRKSK
jgi:hypothetical protein